MWCEGWTCDTKAEVPSALARGIEKYTPLWRTLSRNRCAILLIDMDKRRTTRVQRPGQ